MLMKLLPLVAPAGAVAFAQGGGDMGGMGGGRGQQDPDAGMSVPIRAQKRTAGDIVAERLRLNNDQKH